MKNPTRSRKLLVNTGCYFHKIQFVKYKHSLAESVLLLQIPDCLNNNISV